LSILSILIFESKNFFFNDFYDITKKRCGNIPPEESYICKPGDKVAALVKSSDSANNSGAAATISVTEDDEDESENWILAEVVEYNSTTKKYQVDDIDAEEGQERYTLSKNCVVPLP
jgi:SAGA-associated factor 29